MGEMMNADQLAAVLYEARPADNIMDSRNAGEMYSLGWCSGCDSAREYMARGLARLLEADGAGFDRRAFFAAAGVQDYE